MKYNSACEITAGDRAGKNSPVLFIRMLRILFVKKYSFGRNALIIFGVMYLLLVEFQGLFYSQFHQQFCNKFDIL